jgi:DNA-directed RNA polymerase subunit H
LTKGEREKFDVLSHEYVPHHVLIPREEAKKLLREWGVKGIQLPWIRASDPVARALGARPGDLVKIIRKSEVSGVTVVYRYVVPG